MNQDPELPARTLERAPVALRDERYEASIWVDELRPEFPPVGKKAMEPSCISLCWSADGSTLFSGYTDGAIRVWSVGISGR